MKKSEAAEIVMLLVGAYNRDVADNTARVYEALIVDLDAKECRAAVQRLLGTSKWLPTIAEIREACTAQSHGDTRTGEEAYTELTAAVRAHGRDYGQGAPKFRDPLIARCIGVWGGWNDLCASPSDDPGGRARFIELYDELAGRNRRDIASGMPLPAPSSGLPAFWLQRPDGSGLRQKLPAANGTTSLAAVMAKAPAVRHPDPTPRTWTAEELEQAIQG